MKRILIYIVILTLTVVAPAKPVNIGELIPVRVIGVWMEGKQIRIETDTGNEGIGETAAQALCDLKETASGIIYLDKVEYLILSEQTLDAAEELRGGLNNAVELCVTQYPVDLTETAQYLQVHGHLPKLKSWSKGEELPLISSF